MELVNRPGADVGTETKAVRRDWGLTLTELAEDNFLAPMEAWAGQHHTRLRSQTYGFPPVSLASNRIADLPEGEGKATFQMWREFSDTRWAASAGHLFHRPVISSETWTWLHSPAFRATPLDMKAEADLHFLQGINQLVGHGWPYSPSSEKEPGWRMYAAAALDAHNPWYAAMPELSKYLQRVSFALRQGEPANDVALLLPDDDVYATFSATMQKRATPTSAAGFDESGSNVTLDESMGKVLGDQVIAQVLDSGFGLDFIDAPVIDRVGIPFKALILPGVDRLPLASYEKVLAFARAGGVVIATKRVPGTAPGLLHAKEDTARIEAISRELFSGGIASAHLIENDAGLGAALAKYTKPDMVLSPRTPELGFLHRKVAGGELYFVANTSNTDKHVKATFRDARKYAEIWDAVSGDIRHIANTADVELDLDAYESRLIFFTDQDAPAIKTAERELVASSEADLSRDWTLSFDGPAGKIEPRQLATLQSWSDDPATRYFSGQATYQKSFELSSQPISGGDKLWLDFGEGTTVERPSPPGIHNMRAYLESPVREAAQVYVNGTLAGLVWHPPYRVDVTPFLHPGTNALRVVVGNTAINALAGQALPDYRLLWDRYGMLFVPQDMQDLKPLPSGMLGPVRLVRTRSETAPAKTGRD